MNINEIKNNVAMVINALNTIDVRGKNNLTALGGSIGVLESVYEELQKPQSIKRSAAGSVISGAQVTASDNEE